ncbi:S1C family serine protease [Faecalicatena acetigenes]|uniref:S1C family serine protease n=1 Tax=Faecalicatena acetigenes TaxID=2981790 RepID=A0ABT2TAF9_9FIRM|nr:MULTISPECIES: S1C family serine protease [Lachnospiraceae]MCU6746801.1 S1C family serine protease [Faecalicatena acetigenes]SCH45109.1 Putative serine protease HhoB precursor [uncultured Clostridium sp.]
MLYDEDPKQNLKEGSEKKEGEHFSFLQETIKPQPLSREKILSQLARIAIYGLIFGAFACFSFFALKPLAGKYFQGDPKTVTIPEDEETQENGGTESTAEQDGAPEELNAFSYNEIMESMYTTAAEAFKSCVSVTASSDTEDWESVSTGIRTNVTGVIAADNGQELLILADHSICADAQGWNVIFADGSNYAATLKKQDKNSGLAVFGVSREEITSDTWTAIKVADLGNSNLVKPGDVVIALGNTFGYADGTGYGIISSNSYKEVFSDGECRILATDIACAENGTGILFNQAGQVIGLISPHIWAERKGTTANAFAVSDLKAAIELLVNGESVPYIGISGTAVTNEIAKQQSMPTGMYVVGVDVDSPAMEAGIQNGDIIQDVNGTAIMNTSTYQKAVLECKTGENVKLKGSRLGAGGYVDIEFTVTIGSQE